MQLLFLSWTEIAIIALIVLLLFGGKKIPELMKGMGQGVKSFKDGMNGNALDDTAKKESRSDAAGTKPKDDTQDQHGTEPMNSRDQDGTKPMNDGRDQDGSSRQQ